jgi:hypothetical protein
MRAKTRFFKPSFLDVANYSPHCSPTESQHRPGPQRQHLAAVPTNSQAARGPCPIVGGSPTASQHRTGPSAGTSAQSQRFPKSHGPPRILENGKPPFPGEGGFPLYAPRISNMSPPSVVPPPPRGFAPQVDVRQFDKPSITFPPRLQAHLIASSLLHSVE